MTTSKIIKGVVGGGRYTVTAPIIKEDYGLYLQIEGIELPETYEVDFSNDEHSGTSVTMIGNSDGVLIPSQFIKSGKDVFAFLYHVGEDYGRTVFKFRIPNKLRPDRTNEEPTPEQASTIDQTISALNTAVAKTAQDVIDADASAQASAESAQASDESALSASNSALSSGEYASNALGYAESSSASATASAQSASQAQASAQTAIEKANSILNLTASAQTLPEGSSASASYDAETGVMTFGIPKGADGKNGTDGKDGTPGAKGEPGAKGDPGTDGISPTVSVTDITGGHKVTITDKSGAKIFDVMDGDDYTLTAQDKQDIAELVDVPDSGMVVTATIIYSTMYSVDKTYAEITQAVTDGKNVVILSDGKVYPYAGMMYSQSAPVIAFGSFFAYEGTLVSNGFIVTMDGDDTIAQKIQSESTIPTVNVDDVQINGTSIVQDGVANIPVANASTLGMVMSWPNGGTRAEDGKIGVYPAQSSAIKNGTATYQPIVPNTQHQSVFYGLAKAAGHDEKNSTLPVGEYTPEAQTAIRTMLGLEDVYQDYSSALVALGVI